VPYVPKNMVSTDVSFFASNSKISICLPVVADLLNISSSMKSMLSYDIWITAFEISSCCAM